MSFIHTRWVIFCIFPRMTLGLPRWFSGKESAYPCRRHRFIPGSGRSPGKGNGNPLLYSCLGNPIDRGAWRATVHEAAKNRTRLSTWTCTQARTMTFQHPRKIREGEKTNTHCHSIICSQLYPVNTCMSYIQVATYIPLLVEEKLTISDIKQLVVSDLSVTCHLRTPPLHHQPLL